jgi:hypothetical protein
VHRAAAIAGGQDLHPEAPSVARAGAFTAQVAGIATAGLQFLGAVGGSKRANAIGSRATASAGVRAHVVFCTYHDGWLFSSSVPFFYYRF